MEHLNTTKVLMELLNRPAFCVRDGCIVEANECALQRCVEIGTPIENYLPQCMETYHAFKEGCLFINVSIIGVSYGATVTKLGDCDLFLLEKIADSARQAMALAAQQLRQPLNAVFSIADELKAKPQAEIKHNLNQMHRLICNMSDLNRYDTRAALNMQPTELFGVFSEAMKKAAAAIRVTKVRLRYTALPETAVGMADPEMLERAILNLVSNAVKFSNEGDTVYAKLTRTEDALQFTIQDNGDGIDPEVMQTAFFRYLREPCIEDGRHGIGLGLALVSAVASCHSGTVLITQPPKGGTRVTMTISILPYDDGVLRSPVILPSADYAGGHDHALMEFSDILPTSCYKVKK